MADKPSITPITLADQEAILAFLRKQSGRRPDSSPRPTSWLGWLAKASEIANDNRSDLGWKLTVGGQICGVHFVTPFASVDEQGQPFADLVSHNYFVTEGWRGLPSLALLQRLLALGGRYRLKATTANALSGALWRSFRGTACAGSDVEWYRIRLSISVLIEGLARAVPASLPALTRIIRPERSLTSRLDRVVESLPGVEKLSDVEAVDLAVELGSRQRGPRLALNRALVQWVLSNPVMPHRLVVVRNCGRRSIMMLSASRRGRCGQIACISITGIWSEGDGVDTTAIARTQAAALRQAQIVNYACDVRGMDLPRGTRCRTLDGPRRWFIARGGSPADEHWVGFDAI